MSPRTPQNSGVYSVMQPVEWYSLLNLVNSWDFPKEEISVNGNDLHQTSRTNVAKVQVNGSSTLIDLGHGLR